MKEKKRKTVDEAFTEAPFIYLWIYIDISRKYVPDGLYNSHLGMFGYFIYVNIAMLTITLKS